MIDGLWQPLALACLVGLLLSWAIDMLVRPLPLGPWRRPLAANLTHVGVWIVAFALEVALFRRPVFAVVNVLALELVIVLVSNAKFHLLREPFVFPDFEYFSDAVRHPRLYLPFFGVWRALSALSAYGLALWIGLTMEPSLTATSTQAYGAWAGQGLPLGLFFLSAFALATVGVGLAVLAGRRLCTGGQAQQDLHELGLIAALWAYGRQERAPVRPGCVAAPFATQALVGTADASLPDLVVVQSESFFDARRTFPMIEPSVLAGFDTLVSEASVHGRLQVPAWGANTVRTEFAFLSGIPAEMLGVHRFNPYRRLARQGFPTIASYLKSLGYRTVCIHPYHRTFYRRDRVLPLMGFDEFIDLCQFSEDDYEGQYVGDVALSRRVVAELRQQSTQPLYVHVITMENHGPLHWEHVTTDDAIGLINGEIPRDCHDLIAYVRHLRNADAMFKALREECLERERPTGLCIFGDHVPILPAVYRHFGEVDGATDFVIWQSSGCKAPSEQNADVSKLGDLFLKETGIQRKPAKCIPLGCKSSGNVE